MLLAISRELGKEPEIRLRVKPTHGRAIRRYLMGALSWGGRWTEGELYPFGRWVPLSLETGVLRRTEVTSVYRGYLL